MVLVDRPVANARFVRKEQRKKDGKRVERYRAGHTPTNVQHAESDEDDDEVQHDAVFTGASRPRAPVRVEQKADPRLERLQQQQQDRQGQAPRRPIHEAEVVETPAAAQVTRHEPEDNDDSDEDAYERRRALARMKRQARTQEENPELLATIAKPAAEEEGSEEEYEEVSETDSEEERNQVMAKPVFVAKQHRATELEKRKAELEQRQQEERSQMVLQRKRDEVKNMALQDMRRRQDNNDEAESEGELPDDDDEKDDITGVARELWRKRELQRQLRYKQERRLEEAEKVELERRRNLSEEDRKREDMEYHQQRIKQGLVTERTSLNFMQKYYHKGAFFQATEEKGMQKEELYRRDCNEATGVDKFNKEVLPEVMQVRGNEFGKRGRSKWTHLTAEDTTFQKDQQGNTVDNPFLTATFAQTSSTQSANRAYQAAENHMMFKSQKLTDLTPLAPGAARFGVKDAQHRDHAFERKTKRR